MHGTITNSQWTLALLALLVVFAGPGGSNLWNTFDFAVMALSALTGPFIIFIAPIAAVYFILHKRDRWRFSLLMIAGIGTVIQGVSILAAGASERRVFEVRAATTELLIQILAKQVFLAELVGRRTLARISFDSGWGWIIAVTCVIVGAAVELYVLIRAPLPWKAFVVFSICILAVSLAFPMTFSPQWPTLLASGGIRYWFFPMLAFMASIVWMLSSRNPAPVRETAAVLLVVMVFGMIQDWGHPRPADLDFPTYARMFSELPAGNTFVIPINPVGWSMELTKH
jgi:hypothetical protein